MRAAGIDVAVGVLASRLREDLAEYLYRVGEGLTSGFLQQSRQRWDDAAQSWEQHRAGNRWTEELIYRQSLREQLGNVSGLRILDFGAGSGELSEFLHENGAIVTYVDHSAQMREIARHKTNGVLAAYYLIEDLEGSARSPLFDVVVANMVLHDVEDLGGTLGWLASRLEVGGRLFVTILHPCFKPPVHGWGALSESSVRYMIDRYGNIGLNLTAASGGGPSGIPTLNIHRRLSDYLTALLAVGLVLESVFEPDGRWHPDYFSSPLALADDWFRRAPVLGFLAHKT
ncbi:class I SAM-dependent methyltransferase [Stenotrophomonas geniculata]|uniref:class I SAM-dependent methyltransferase n=1 Tax=Stenotrophomonas geniculata TaxID=86188 RepID=UPI003B0243EB